MFLDQNSSFLCTHPKITNSWPQAGWGRSTPTAILTVKYLGFFWGLPMSLFEYCYIFYSSFITCKHDSFGSTSVSFEWVDKIGWRLYSLSRPWSSVSFALGDSSIPVGWITVGWLCDVAVVSTRASKTTFPCGLLVSTKLLYWWVEVDAVDVVDWSKWLSHVAVALDVGTVWLYSTGWFKSIAPDVFCLELFR